MDYKTWEADVPKEIKNEPIWKFAGYRKALYLYDLIWDDTDSWMKDDRGRKLADQIVRSSSSVSANLEEGLGRAMAGNFYITTGFPSPLPAKPKAGFTALEN